MWGVRLVSRALSSHKIHSCDKLILNVLLRKHESTIILEKIRRISSKCGSREESEILKLQVILSTRKTKHKIVMSTLHQRNSQSGEGWKRLPNNN